MGYDARLAFGGIVWGFSGGNVRGIVPEIIQKASLERDLF